MIACNMVSSVAVLPDACRPVGRSGHPSTLMEGETSGGQSLLSFSLITASSVALACCWSRVLDRRQPGPITCALLDVVALAICCSGALPSARSQPGWAGLSRCSRRGVRQEPAGGTTGSGVTVRHPQECRPQGDSGIDGQDGDGRAGPEEPGRVAERDGALDRGPGHVLTPVGRKEL